MHLGTRLRRASATTILLLGLLAGLATASANADAPPLIEWGRQTPHTAEQTPGIPPRQHNRHPTALTLANTSHHIIKSNSKPKHSVIDDGNTRQHRIHFNQAVRYR